MIQIMSRSSPQTEPAQVSGEPTCTVTVMPASYCSRENSSATGMVPTVSDVVRHREVPGVVLVLHRALLHHRGAGVLAVGELDLAAELGPAGVGPAVHDEPVVAVEGHGVLLAGEAFGRVVVDLGDGLAVDHGRVAEHELQAGHPVDGSRGSRGRPSAPGTSSGHTARLPPCPIRVAGVFTPTGSGGLSGRSIIGAGSSDSCVAAGCRRCGSRLDRRIRRAITRTGRKSVTTSPSPKPWAT